MYKNYFIVNGNAVRYRKVRDSYQARYRRDGYNIEVSGRSLKITKLRFLERFNFLKKQRNQQQIPLFREVVQEWLSLKNRVVKENTYYNYQSLVRLHLFPKFGEKHIDEITRKDVQAFLFEFTDRGRYRTAQKLKQILASIYGLAEEDYPTIRSPMRKIILPECEERKGRAFTIADESKIVEYCKKNSHYQGNSGLLLLLYTGIRVGERKTLRYDDKYIYCESEKIRRGKASITRKIPISPMLKKVIDGVDFELAKRVSCYTIRDALKRIFPERHINELRYTFITRAKECGCNPELIMKWVGHTFDKDVITSRVDRGYTDFSDEYNLKEIEKYNYKLDVEE